eukprot:CAMPEP_0173193970 /NCGR_PEP_ID=MMETSP1141-20130122/14252_1 /TAXON_ID=483371 /ORGANISM="non described non described, Strain CCMP2298" /LENGTH=71 /DNA_ID=CAMNT_0014118361 /DNA_START=228 /DNA_END=443 /DNA_ORIENTATION=+
MAVQHRLQQCGARAHKTHNEDGDFGGPAAHEADAREQVRREGGHDLVRLQQRLIPVELQVTGLPLQQVRLL